MSDLITDWYQNTSSFKLAVVFIALSVAFWYIFIYRRSGRPSPQIFPGGIVRPEPSTGKIAPVERKDLLDVVTTQPIVTTNSAGQQQIGFPTSPIMPHLNVIDGVSPYNPDIAGKEWADTTVPMDPSRPGKSASTSLYEVPAIGAPVKTRTPTPGMIPVPTMVPSPINTSVAKKESFFEGGDPYNGFTNQPELVNIKTPIDAQMSKWTQFGPCDPTTGLQERTRTCIHDGIDGGSPCAHTVEQRRC